MCILSPLLFALYVEDLFSVIKKGGGKGVYVGGDTGLEIRMILYADDLVLIAENEVGLQKSLGVLENFVVSEDLMINSDKTVVMICQKGGNVKSKYNWYINKVKLRIVKQFLYLEILFSFNGKWGR